MSERDRYVSQREISEAVSKYKIVEGLLAYLDSITIKNLNWFFHKQIKVIESAAG
jgi:hypothetical protein